MIKTKIKYYRFELDKTEDNKTYKLLCEELTNKGLTLFDCISLNNYEQKTEHFNKIKELEQKGFIELETEFIFNNQWNTSKESFNLRVFDWYEEIYPNKNIKEGYYLVLNEEMINIRKNTFSCGYCGKQYNQKERENLTFCNSCLDSEFLTEDNLFLLRLRRIDDKTERFVLNNCDEEVLKQNYYKAQKKGRLKRLNKIKQDNIKRLKEDRKNNETEYKGFMWLIKNNLNFDNVIYYNHLNKFSFGWKNPLNFKEEQDLKKVLENEENRFPYDYEIKV